MNKAQQLSELVKDIARNSEAVAVGIATTESLRGGPPSTDLTYVLPEARSAIVFALPLDQGAIERFLKKEDMASANIDNRRVNVMATGIALTLSDFLAMKGFRSVPITANAVYRQDTPRGPFDMAPPISHRYLAVRSGLGHFGFSGNVITKEYGAAVLFGSVVTAAELIPTDPLPPEESYCDKCHLCMAACASGLMSPDEDAVVTMGGVEFSYAKRRTYGRCNYVCGGFTGLHQSGQWSTWSPARFPIPENDDEFQAALIGAAGPYFMRPKINYGLYHPMVPGDLLEFTCGHCQFICNPDKKVRQERFKMLTNSGVVVQNDDGSLEAVSPEEAKKRLAVMSPERRTLYEK